MRREREGKVGKTVGTVQWQKKREESGRERPQRKKSRRRRKMCTHSSSPKIMFRTSRRECMGRSGRLLKSQCTPVTVIAPGMQRVRIQQHNLCQEGPDAAFGLCRAIGGGYLVKETLGVCFGHSALCLHTLRQHQTSS
eukprot:1233142-Rhodomonas_salina.2